MFRRSLCAVSVALLFGCASEPGPMRAGIAPNPRFHPPNPTVAVTNPENPVMIGDPAWAAEAAKWIGAPYRAGGSSRDGMDEPGLVLRIYENVARIRLPSGLDELSRTGIAIPREQLHVGDIVFFGNPQINSAGIFLGENRIVTASPSIGVVYAQLSDSPFSGSYRTARRLLR